MSDGWSLTWVEDGGGGGRAASQLGVSRMVVGPFWCVVVVVVGERER